MKRSHHKAPAPRRLAVFLAVSTAVIVFTVVIVFTGIGIPQAHAQAPPTPKAATDTESPHDEPGGCVPTCRSGFMCKKGKCISLCNPPCPNGQRCVKGECELMPRVGEPTRRRYFALLGGTRVALNDPAATFGELRGEVGSRWISFQIGGGFGSHINSLRAAIIGHISYQPSPTVPLYVQPRLGFGYAFNWVDTNLSLHQQDLFVTPGVRLRWDVLRKMSFFLDPIQLEIAYLRLESDDKTDLHRVAVAAVHWGVHLGVAFIY
ncbi:MAG: hypothetical protein KAI47_02050 [Deltaproteobacteria bacterium]|nr:hypothetical protein [Deltaproteobacteria bacterium]